MRYAALQQMLQCNSTGETAMFNQIQEFMTEQTQVLAEQAQKFRDDPVETARGAASGSAESLKALKDPVRTIARSGVKLTAISQHTLQALIELQSEIVTSALTDAANRLERAARADDVIDLVQEQTAALRATRDRVVDEAAQVLAIFREAGREVGKVATQAYARVVETTEDEQPVARKTRARKAKRAVRKTPARARKAA
jgi:predicted metal-dependent hydrolase